MFGRVRPDHLAPPATNSFANMEPMSCTNPNHAHTAMIEPHISVQFLAIYPSIAFGSVLGSAL